MLKKIGYCAHFDGVVIDFVGNSGIGGDHDRYSFGRNTKLEIIILIVGSRCEFSRKGLKLYINYEFVDFDKNKGKFVKLPSLLFKGNK